MSKTINTLNIDDQGIIIRINGDPDREIQFDPNDVVFIEAFYELVMHFQAAHAEYTKVLTEADLDTDKDGDGIPDNMTTVMAVMRKSCVDLREQIDIVFGDGTAQKALGSSLSLDTIIQFFDGIQPFIEKERNKKVEAYKKKKK